MKQINIEQLIMLVAIFFIIYFLMNMKETFAPIENESKVKHKPKSTECAQLAIDKGYNDYIFGGVKFIR
jgi:hypothetical protein